MSKVTPIGLVVVAGGFRGELPLPVWFRPTPGIGGPPHVVGGMPLVGPVGAHLPEAARFLSAEGGSLAFR